VLNSKSKFLAVLKKLQLVCLVVPHFAENSNKKVARNPMQISIGQAGPLLNVSRSLLNASQSALIGPSRKFARRCDAIIQ